MCLRSIRPVPCALVACCCVACNPKNTSPGQGPAASANGAALATLTVTSAAFSEGQPVPATHACPSPRKGECDFGTSPPIAWTAGPAQTKSYAILACDPDGRDWLHWVAVGLPPATSSLAAGASGGCKSQLPAGGRDGRNEFGFSGYGGPCPPAGSGVHHYVFTVYALSVPAPALPDSTSCAEVRAAIERQALARGVLIGTYKIDR
jgi:Raf kinase inhibitor-like YbhB/YbcL family protein